MTVYSSIIEQVKIARKKRHKSQEDMALLLNLGRDAYRKMENGQSPLNLERFLIICDHLQIDPRDLMDQVIPDKQKWEYEAEIDRLKAGIEDLRLERERLWTALNRLLKIIDPQASDEAYRVVFQSA
ncbi:helix-turn-helix domain-containing protein [Croceimicrobium sp.]|uniref:helix-turn-helix domain-containing protein n=1 Tax=Croceimicrobium sp. TaxID=2828340 RepID=UPI003BAA507A